MRNKKKVLRIITLTVLLIVVIYIFLVFNSLNTKLLASTGPTLPAFKSPTPRPTNTAVFRTTPTKGTSPGERTEEIKPKGSQPKPTCGGPPQMIILVIGADNQIGYYLGLADLIRVVKVDFINQSISALAFPRDIWVRLPQVPSLIDREITHGKINESYYYGNFFELPGGGSHFLAQTLYDNFGVASDRYVTINESVFIDVVDAAGGIYIYVPYTLKDQEGNFFSGWNHLGGEKALLFARIRKLDTDRDRIDRQTQVIMALRERLLSPEIIPKVTDIIDSVFENMLLDISKKELLSLFCLALKIDPADITAVTIPTDMLTQGVTEDGRQWILIADEEKIRQLVAEFISENSP